jgi:ABC-type nitrate/sulfonate/bicarbonate transport system substrate-binding protein
VALNRYIIILAVFIIIIALLLSFIYSQQDNAVPFESLTIGISHIESSTPFYIAQDYGFFKNNRLNITYIEYSTGLAATNAMQKSEVDIAIGVADYVFASKVLDNQPVKTIGSFAQTDFIFLVTRNDINISNISDLAQKTIALHSGTVQEYYLGKFFELNNL